MFIIILFCLPETLHLQCRNIPVAPNPARHALRRLRLRKHAPLHPWVSFRRALCMARYPSVVFPALYLAVAHGLGTFLPALTVSAIFRERYGFSVLQTGAAYGTATAVGSLAGEVRGFSCRICWMLNV